MQSYSFCMMVLHMRTVNCSIDGHAPQQKNVEGHHHKIQDHDRSLHLPAFLVGMILVGLTEHAVIKNTNQYEIADW